MRVSYSTSLSLAPAEAYEILLSPRLARERMASLGAGTPEVEGPSKAGEVIARFTVPKKLLPEMAQAFVKAGEVLQVSTRPAEESSAEHPRTFSELLPSSLPLEVRITVSVEPDVSVGADVLPEPDVSASQLTYIAEYSIGVPLFGKKLERACQGWISDLLRADAERVEELGRSLT